MAVLAEPCVLVSSLRRHPFTSQQTMIAVRASAATRGGCQLEIQTPQRTASHARIRQPAEATGEGRLHQVTRCARRLRIRGEGAFIDLKGACGHGARSKMRVPPSPSRTSESNTQCWVRNHPSQCIAQAGNVSPARE